MNNPYPFTAASHGLRHALRTLIAAGLLAAGSPSLLAQGDFWRPLNIGSNLIAAITIDSSGDYIAASTPTDGSGRIHVSRTRGASWEPSPADVGSNVHALATAPNGHIFAGSSNDGVFRSTDRGATWTPTGLTKSYIAAIAVAPNGDIYAGTDQVVQRSTDDGATWTASTTGLSGPPEAIVALSSGSILVGTYEQGVFKSNDGLNWDHLGLAHPDFPTVSIADMAVDRNNTIYAALQEGGIFTSIDNGDHWGMLPEPFPGADVLSLAVTGNGDLYAGTFRRGVWHSADQGSHWDSTGLADDAVGSLAFDPAGFVLAGTEHDLFLHTDVPAGVDDALAAGAALAVAVEPNPIRDGGRISFELPRRAAVTVTVVDERGRSVATLFDGTLDAGRHGVDCNAAALLPPGVYFCSVRAGEITAAARLVVVR
jgi:ligand-binding sensor domain-containing protein